jgi:hypothetical protein
VDTPREVPRPSVEEHLDFWIDESAKALVFSPVLRLPNHRESRLDLAVGAGIHEFDLLPDGIGPLL